MRRLSDTDRHITFFIDHPGVVKPADQANGAKKAAQILRGNPDRDDHIETVARRGTPKQHTARQQDASRQTVAWTEEFQRPSLTVVGRHQHRPSALVRWQRLVNLCHGTYLVFPA